MSGSEAARAGRRALALIMAVYLGLGLAMSLIVPLGEAPDELDHFLYLRYLATARAIPPLSPVAAENPTMEANQPPLYYALGAAATAWADMRAPLELPQNACFSFDPADPGRQTFYVHTTAEAPPWRGTVLGFQAARFFSLLLGALAVALTFALGRRVMPADPRTAVLAAALLAFNPQFLFITASVNNDVLTAVLGAAIVLGAISCWRNPRPLSFALLGLLVGLGALTKAGLLALWPVALLAAAAPLVGLLFVPRGTERPWGAALRRSLLPLALTAGLPLLVAGWWYGRATLLYGDPLAWRVHLAAKGPFVLREGGLGLGDLAEFADLHFRSYWALFGWLNVAVPEWVYALLALLVGTAVAGLLGGVAACWRRRADCALDLPAVALSGLAVLGTYAALLRYIQTINWSGYQGRLAFAAFAPAAALLAAGLAALAGRLQPRRAALAGALRWSGPALLLGVALYALLALLPAAYPRPGIYQPEGLSPACARFAPGLLLDGFTAAERVAPGETLAVTLATYGLDGAAGQGTLAAELRGDGGEVWGRAETSVSWTPGETLVVALPLAVEEMARPGRATLVAGLRAADGGWAGARSANGRDLPQPQALQTVKIPAPAVSAVPQQALAADFGGVMALQGYDLARAGDALRVTLHWRAPAAPEGDYTTFVHLLDGDGRLLAQADGQPGDGAYPTGIWDAGELVLDAKQLNIPPDAGTARLVAGVYGPDGVRLPLTGSAHDVVTLATLAPGGARP